MLLASNAAEGMTIDEPDVCLTPLPVPVPIPYVNVAENATAVKFAETITITAAPALNVGSLLATSFGDEPGVAHWTIMGWVLFVLGSPKVTLEGTPAVSLLSECISNKGNAVAGLQAVPSATNVTYTLARPAAAPPDAAAVHAELHDALEGPSREVTRRM